MKNFKLLSLFILTIFFANCSGNKSNTNDEQEIRNLMAQYDEAAVNNDQAFFEQKIASDYQISTEDGRWENKAATLQFMKEDIEKPTYKLVSLKSDSIQVRVLGDVAVVTGKWLAATQALKDPKPVMHNDEGRFTSILEKRNGEWLLVTDHVSEKPHNKQELETQLTAASESYDTGLLDKDKTLFEGLFADDYAATGSEGKITSREEDINHMTSPDMIFLTSKTDDKNFRIYRNSAVETGRYSSTGSFKGKPFSETGRYTTTWIYRDGKWRIVADHTSPMPDL